MLQSCRHYKKILIDHISSKFALICYYSFRTSRSLGFDGRVCFGNFEQYYEGVQKKILTKCLHIFQMMYQWLVRLQINDFLKAWMLFAEQLVSWKLCVVHNDMIQCPLLQQFYENLLDSFLQNYGAFCYRIFQY